jgi:hypothetical protein
MLFMQTGNVPLQPRRLIIETGRRRLQAVVGRLFT